MQSSQNKVNNWDDLLINLSLLLSIQKNSMLLEINPINLNKSLTSLGKNILSSNESTIEKKDIDLDINISEDKFNFEFLNGPKVFST